MSARILPFVIPESRTTKQPRLNLRDICDLICKSCEHTWVAPVPEDEVACPKCHSTDLRCRDVRRENAVRVN